MAIEGALEDVGLADICQLIALGRKTGCLSVTDRSNFGYIYFEGGRVTYASVLNRPDRLGDLLVKNGVISEEVLDDAMALQTQEPGKRLGQILVEEKSLEESELNRYISIQIEEAVYHLFGWTRGTFHFDPDQSPDEEGVFLVSINPESLLMEGARRVDEWGEIEKKIRSFDLIFSLEKDPAEEDGVELTSAQRRILPLVDGQRTVADIVEDSGLVEFEAAKALYGLIQAGFANASGRRTGDSGETDDLTGQQHVNLGNAFYKAGMLEDAEREYRAALGLEPANAGLRARLGIIALKGDRPQEAVDQFAAIADDPGPTYGTLRNHALALELLSRYQEALEVIARVRALAPEDGEVLLQQGIVELKSGRPDAAVASFERYRKYLGADPPPALYYAFAVLAMAVAGKVDRAVLLGREGMGHYPSDGPLLVNMGVVLERQGEPEAAEALYLRAVADAPTPPQAHKNLGDLAYRRADGNGARAHYERAVQLDPALGDDVYLKLGNLAYKDNDPDWAMLLWQRALELNPENDIARTNLEMLAATPGQ